MYSLLLYLFSEHEPTIALGRTIFSKKINHSRKHLETAVTFIIPPHPSPITATLSTLIPGKMKYCTYPFCNVSSNITCWKVYFLKQISSSNIKCNICFGRLFTKKIYLEFHSRAMIFACKFSFLSITIYKPFYLMQMLATQQCCQM